MLTCHVLTCSSTYMAGYVAYSILAYMHTYPTVGSGVFLKVLVGTSWVVLVGSAWELASGWWAVVCSDRW